MKRSTNKSVKIFSIFLFLGLLFILFAPLNHNHCEGVRSENDICEICEMIKVSNKEFEKVISAGEAACLAEVVSIDYIIENDVFDSTYKVINTLVSLKTCIIN